MGKDVSQIRSSKRGGFSMSVGGMEKLMDQLALMSAVIDSEGTEEELLEVAEQVRDKIKSLAPQGPTGNLKKGVVAHTFRRKVRGRPAVFVAMDYRYAPHAHLVEFGTDVRRVKTKQIMSDGSKFYGVSLPPTKPHPFFRPGVDAMRDKVGKLILPGLAEEIEKAAKK